MEAKKAAFLQQRISGRPIKGFDKFVASVLPSLIKKDSSNVPKHLQRRTEDYDDWFRCLEYLMHFFKKIYKSIGSSNPDLKKLFSKSAIDFSKDDLFDKLSLEIINQPDHFRR